MMPSFFFLTTVHSRYKLNAFRRTVLYTDNKRRGNVINTLANFLSVLIFKRRDISTMFCALFVKDLATSNSFYQILSSLC